MKPTVVYPSDLERKILAQEAPGGPPASLDIVIPSVTRPGEPFGIGVAVLDEVGYPSAECRGAARVSLPGRTVVEIPFRAGVPAVARVENVRLPRKGLFRLGGRCGGLRARSNPTLCTPEDVPGIYWGDPHVHTVLSNCHPDRCRSLNFCFTAARWVSALDWVAAADHVSNGRCDFSKWKEQRTVSDLYDDPPRFVTLPAYEASFRGGAGGDNNVYMARFPDMFADEYEAGTVRTLCARLAERLRDDEFFVVPHHTTRTDKHGEIPDDIYPGPDAMPVVEIHSKWGTSEYRGNPNPLKAVHDGPSYANDLLGRGLRLGFVAGTDTHATMPAGGGRDVGHIDRLPGLTAVRCGTLDRQSVFDAIRGRQCYAASLERILMHGSIAGCPFGGGIPFMGCPTPRRVDVLVAARSDIVRVDVVRNGKTVHTVAPDSWKARVVYEDAANLDAIRLTSPHLGRFVYYYVRAICASGAQAWSSPVWAADGPETASVPDVPGGAPWRA